jgi:hypothetical protein
MRPFIWEHRHRCPQAALRSAFRQVGTALHPSKDFAVSPGLNRLVSARTSRITPTGVTCYSCHNLATTTEMFGLSSPSFEGAIA